LLGHRIDQVRFVHVVTLSVIVGNALWWEWLYLKQQGCLCHNEFHKY
jgi:hypothetical protein